MTSSDYKTEMDEYWNESGGKKWVENLGQIERVLRPVGQTLLDVMSSEHSVSVLDVGCGGADLAARIAALLGQDSEVIASDISLRILEEARRNHKGDNLGFLHCDVEIHDFEPDFFDVVVSRFGVMFFANPLKAFINLRSSMRKGGRLNLLVWQSFDENLWMKVPASAAFKILEKPEPPKEGDPGPFSLSDSEIFGDLLTKAGFCEISFLSNHIDLNLGQIEEAVNLMTQLGPAAGPYTEASNDLQGEARRLIRDSLSNYESNAGVSLPAAFWLVQATST
ncbi:MAG: methyltransferase domain-containing protein [Pseudomonadota bacterium]|nr:methyltransferase domain-containing protein [Pseudomonadota bacterium]